MRKTATHVDELPDDVRAKVLKQIGTTEKLSAANALANRIIDRVDALSVKLEELKPDIELLWLEFDKLEDGETIMGCSTKTAFSEQYLHRSLRAIQYMLAGGNPANKQKQPSEIISPSPKPIKEYEALVDAVPVIRAGKDIVPPSQYGVAEIEETVTAFTINLVSQLKTVADRKTIYRSLMRKFEDLLGECDAKTNS